MAHISMKDIYMNTYNVKCYFVVVYLHSCWCVVQCFSCKKLNSFITYTQRKKTKTCVARCSAREVRIGTIDISNYSVNFKFSHEKRKLIQR